MLNTNRSNNGYVDFLVLKQDMHILNKNLVRNVSIFEITYELAFGLWFTSVS
jgi:hypothetical protein